MPTFRCECGAVLHAGPEMAGEKCVCSNCRRTVRVPFDAPGPTGGSAPGTGRMAGMFTVFLIAAAVFLAAGLVLAALLAHAIWIAVGAAAALIPVACSLRLLYAYNRAFRGHSKESDLFLGSVKLVLWDPTEGVLFLKNKAIDHVDDNPHDGGGVRFLFPVLGEELGLRVPLTLQALKFNDRVLTRDHIYLSTATTLWWKLHDLRRFYLLVSREVHGMNDRDQGRILSPTALIPFTCPHCHASTRVDPRYAGTSGPCGRCGGTIAIPASAEIVPAQNELRAAEHWITLTAESESRALFARASTGILVAEQIAAAIPAEMREAPRLAGPSRTALSQPSPPPTYHSVSDLFSGQLQLTLQPKMSEYGIEISRVELQEISLPPELLAAAVDAYKASYLPRKAEWMAQARKLELEAEAHRLKAESDILGREAIALREVLANTNPSFIGLPSFLEQFFGQMGKTLGKA